MSLLLEFLREHPEGVNADEIATEVLRLTGPEKIVIPLAESALRDAGAAPGPDGRWRLPEPAPARCVAVAGVCTGPYPGLDRLQDIALVEVSSGATGREFATLLRDASPLPARAADLLRGARLIGLGDEETVSHVSRLPDLDPAGKPLRLGRVLKRLGLIERGEPLARAADRFGVPVPEEPRAVDRARAAAAVFIACLEEGIPIEAPPPSPEPFDFGGMEVDRTLLDGLPGRPGVYRFYDRCGGLLYVGKTKDLRRRVSGYFAHRGRRRRLFAAMMAELHHLDWSETGSDIMALLMEAREIREHAPRFNVQREVHKRRGAPRDAAVFLPGREAGEIEVLLLREGAPVASVTSDGRAKGMREIRRALRVVYHEPEREPAAPDGAAIGITATWLRRTADAVNLVDLSQAGDLNDAARLIRAALTDPELFARKSFYR